MYFIIIFSHLFPSVGSEIQASRFSNYVTPAVICLDYKRDKFQVAKRRDFSYPSSSQTFPLPLYLYHMGVTSSSSFSKQ